MDPPVIFEGKRGATSDGWWFVVGGAWLVGGGGGAWLVVRGSWFWLA
jgi:hypothetical protein